MEDAMRRLTPGGNRWPWPVWLAVALVAAVTVATVVALVENPGGSRSRPERAAGQPSARAGEPRSGASASPGATTAPADGQRNVEACVAGAVSRLSPEGLAGQLLMVGTPVANPQSLAGTVSRYRLGGVFLAGRGSQPAATLRQGIGALQERAAASGVPLHIAVDQEGGQVQTLKGADFPLIPMLLWTSRGESSEIGQ
jgi:beta-N-acetylhexosaminidase